MSFALHMALFLGVEFPLPEIGTQEPVQTRPIRARISAMQLGPDAIAPQAIVAEGKNDVPLVRARPVAAAEGAPRDPTKVYVDNSTRYFKAKELDNRPAIQTPALLDVEGISPVAEGEAVLRFYIDEKGEVDQIEVERSSLPASMLETLLQRREQLRFTPGGKNGVNLKSVMRYQIELKRDPSIKVLTQPGQGLAPSLPPGPSATGK